MASAEAKSTEVKRTAPRWLVALSFAVAAIFALPTIYLVLKALNNGLDFGTSDALVGPLSRSLMLGLSVAVVSTVLGVTTALAISNTDVFGKRVWKVLVVLPLAIPSYVGASAWRASFANGGLVDQVPLPAAGFFAATCVLALLSYPLVTLPVYARLLALSPSLDESARILGAGRARRFRTVMWPQIAPAAISGALLTFLYALCDFGAVSLLRFDVLTNSIYSTRLFDTTRSVTLSLVLGIAALAVVFLQDLWVRRHHLAPRGHLQKPIQKLGAWRIPVTGYLFLVTTVALVTPLFTLGWWAFRKNNFTTDDIWGPALNTVLCGILAAVVVTLLVMPIAFLSQRYKSPSGRLITPLVTSGFALPGIVIAIALVYWTVQLPEWTGLYQSFAVLIVAYAVHFGSQGLQATQTAVNTVSSRQVEAATLLGAKAIKRMRTVYLPSMAPGLLAGGGLVLLSTMKELPATLLLAPIGFETIATSIWNASEDGFLAEVGFQSIILVIISAALTWLLVLRRMDRLS